jgi:hypothetical protein
MNAVGEALIFYEIKRIQIRVYENLNLDGWIAHPRS